MKGISSVAQSCLTLCSPMDPSTPGFPVHHQLQNLLQLMSIESGMPSNHLILCHPLLLLPSVFPSIRVFSNESVLCIRWPKYRCLNISPSNEALCSDVLAFDVWSETLGMYFPFSTKAGYFINSLSGNTKLSSDF